MIEKKAKETLARNLQYFLDKKGIDRNQLCTDLDLKYSTVSEWFQGKKYPRINKIETLANYFGIKKSDLIEESSKVKLKDNNIDVSTHFKISSHERELVVAYREHPESQPVIDKILDIDKPKTFKVMTAARSADGRTEIKDIEMTAEEVEKLDNIPETDEQF